MTMLVDVGWYALACCLLAGGAIGLSVLCWVVAVAFFAFNAALALVGSRRSPADRLGGVTVTSTWRVPAALTRIGGAVRRRGAAARCGGAVRRRGQPDYLEPAEPTPPASRRGRRRATR